ncbi:MAG: hypothetical protein ACW990_15060 [Promethearchaeota archaeon]
MHFCYVAFLQQFRNARCGLPKVKTSVKAQAQANKNKHKRLQQVVMMIFVMVDMNVQKDY